MRLPHEVLGVAENATLEEVIEAHRKLMLHSIPTDALFREEIDRARDEMARKFARSKEMKNAFAEEFPPTHAFTRPTNHARPSLIPLLFFATGLSYLRNACEIIAFIWLLFSWEWQLLLVGLGITLVSPIVIGPALLPNVAAAATMMNQRARVSSAFLPLCRTWLIVSAWGISVMWLAQMYAHNYASHKTNLLPIALWTFAAAASPIAHLAGREFAQGNKLPAITLAFQEIAIIAALTAISIFGAPLFAALSAVYVPVGAIYVLAIPKWAARELADIERDGI